MITKCSEEVEFMYSGNLHQTIDNLDLYNDIDYFFPGTGLDCEHKISFMVSSNVFSSIVYEYDIEEGSDLILSWSDWTYSLIWESVPIEN